ncbi:hypothetical protein MVEN_01473400 [Mycena venus]|uniref:Uncharacterized protein n=1 Tax=Mycena venus TaxID=2733690 RepID=A0A8H7CT76_9AGAR|nr:hypothetical protein MVEN_01473400 [Mycena venus]
MAFIPQELIDAIVSGIDDMCSLKACALAGSMFRKPSQRTIFHSLELNKLALLGRACRLFCDSPHIPAYITRLNIGFTWKASAAEVENLPDIFSKLENVQRFTLGGIRHGDFSDVPTFPSVLLDFLARQPLRELYIFFSDISKTVFFRLLATSPVVSFFWVNVTDNNGENPTLGARDKSEHSLTKVEDLDLRYTNAGELLAQPQFRLYTQVLRCLTFLACEVFEGASIFTVASYLQQLPHLNIFTSISKMHVDPSLYPASPHFAPPNSPRRLGDIGTTPVLPPQFSILFQPPSPRHLCSRTLSSRSPHCRWKSAVGPEKPLVLDPALLLALDTALVTHPANPGILWRLDFNDNVDEPARTKRFSEFIAEVQRGMPTVYPQGRLMFEQYKLQRMLDGWTYI